MRRSRLDHLSQLALLLEPRVPEAALSPLELLCGFGARALADLRLVPARRGAVRAHDCLTADSAREAARRHLVALAPSIEIGKAHRHGHTAIGRVEGAEQLLVADSLSAAQEVTHVIPAVSAAHPSVSAPQQVDPRAVLGAQMVNDDGVERDGPPDVPSVEGAPRTSALLVYHNLYVDLT